MIKKIIKILIIFHAINIHAQTVNDEIVIINTSEGNITLHLDGKRAPITVSNFVNLIKADYFDKEFIGPFQTRTGGHSRLDFDLTRDFAYSDLSGHLMFTASNLLDVVGRDHLESKKGQVQLPGRSFQFMLNLFY